MDYMEYMDFETWPRREHFAFFQAMRNPCLSITAQVDASGLAAFRERRVGPKVRFTDMAYHAIMKSMNAIPEFRMRLVNKKPVIFAQADAAFTYIGKGRALHANCVAAYDEDFSIFSKNVQAARDAADLFPTLTPPGGESQGLVYLSCLPDIAFTAASNPWGDPWTDSVPRVFLGKVDAVTKSMPVAVEALHSFVDGIHMAAFFKNLDRALGESL